jgi:cAMP phosphodiesterase
MIQTFTQHDVVRYVYEETTEDENLMIQDGLVHDSEMLEFYLDMLDVKAGLDKSYQQPSERSIDNILAYSRNYKESHHTLVR